MSQLQFLACYETRTLLQSLFSDQPMILPAFSSAEAPTYSFSRVVKINNPSGSRIYQPVSIAGETVRVALGDAIGIPIAGSFTLTYGADTTAAIVFNATAAEVQAALNAIASIIAAGYVDVTLDAASFYLIAFRVVGVRTQISGDYTNLAPLSIVTTGTLIDGTVSLKEVQTAQVTTQPCAFDTPVTNLPAADIDMTQLTAGGSGSNAKYSALLTPYPFDGSFTLTIPNGKKTTITLITLANPTHITATAHGLATGDTVTITGSDSTPTVNGSRAVTVIDADTFSVAVNVTIAGTTGVVQTNTPQETDFILFSASATDLTTALEALTNVGTGNVDVSKQSDGSWIFMFIGTLANTDMGTITGDDSALQVLTGFSGTLDLRTASTTLVLGGEETIAADFAIQITPTAGTPFDCVSADATLNMSLIKPGSASPPLQPFPTSGFSWTITRLQGGTSADLDAVATTGIGTGYLQGFVLAASPGVKQYQLQAGTDATAAPGIIRPLDFNSGTNARVWVQQS